MRQFFLYLICPVFLLLSACGTTDDAVREIERRDVQVQLDVPRVLYVGIRNPLSIATVEGELANVDINVDNGVVRKESSVYYAIPERPGYTQLNINALTINENSFSFLAKQVPLPEAYLNIDGNIVTANAIEGSRFRSADNLGMTYADFPLDVNFDVHSFEVLRLADNGRKYSERNEGSTFERRAKNLIRDAEAGDFYIFKEIVITCGSDPTERSVKPFTVEIR